MMPSWGCSRNWASATALPMVAAMPGRQDRESSSDRGGRDRGKADRQSGWNLGHWRTMYAGLDRRRGRISPAVQQHEVGIAALNPLSLWLQPIMPALCEYLPHATRRRSSGESSAWVDIQEAIATSNERTYEYSRTSFPQAQNTGSGAGYATAWRVYLKAHGWQLIRAPIYM